MLLKSQKNQRSRVSDLLKLLTKIKRKNKKKIKDPNAPKRPLGPYFFYFKENNNKIKSEHPELIQKGVVARIAKDWKALNEEEKAPFVEKSKEDKLRYVREKKAYDEIKQKEEEEANDEEEKDNWKWKRNKRKRQSSHSKNNKNGSKRIKHEWELHYNEETAVRLADIVSDISIPSDSDALAPYSPPPISNDGINISVVEKQLNEVKKALKGQDEQPDKQVVVASNEN